MGLLVLFPPFFPQGLLGLTEERLFSHFLLYLTLLYILCTQRIRLQHMRVFTTYKREIMFTVSMGISDGKLTLFAKSKSHKFYHDLCLAIICIAVMELLLKYPSSEKSS